MTIGLPAVPDMPDFTKRFDGSEMMDDADVPAELLEKALHELPALNRYLGGYRATRRVLDAMLRSGPLSALRILDVGTGIGDYPRELVRWGFRHGVDVSVVGVDISEAAVAAAREASRSWRPEESARVSFAVADARDLPYPSDDFSVVTSALFFHHLSDREAAGVLHQMSRIARLGVIVNDIHRSRIAYHGIRALTASFGFSEMVRHDGPISVLRAFSREDLERIGRMADIGDFSVRWSPAFRWILTNLRGPSSTTS